TQLGEQCRGERQNCQQQEKPGRTIAVRHVGQIAIGHPSPEEITGFPTDQRNPENVSELSLSQTEGSIQVERTEISHDAESDGAQSETCGHNPKTSFEKIRPFDLGRYTPPGQERPSCHNEPQDEPDGAQ